MQEGHGIAQRHVAFGYGGDQLGPRKSMVQ